MPIVSLVTLAWGSLASCGDIVDGMSKTDLKGIRQLLKDDPRLLLRKDSIAQVTPLQLAAAMGTEEMVGLLLAKGAKVSAKDEAEVVCLCSALRKDGA